MLLQLFGRPTPGCSERITRTQGGDHGDFVVAGFGSDNTCNGQTLAKDATCNVVVSFAPSGAANQRSTDLVVSSDNPADGQPSAALTGTVPG